MIFIVFILQSINKEYIMDWILCLEYLFGGVIVFDWDLKEIFRILNVRFKKHQINILRQTRYFYNSLFQIN